MYYNYYIIKKERYTSMRKVNYIIENKGFSYTTTSYQDAVEKSKQIGKGFKVKLSEYQTEDKPKVNRWKKILEKRAER